MLHVGIFCKLLVTHVLVKRSKEVEVAGQHTAGLLVTGYSDMPGRLQTTFTRVLISHPVTAIHMVMRLCDVILVNNQLDVLFSMYLFISLLYMYRATQCSSSGESNCINTSSGICHSV